MNLPEILSGMVPRGSVNYFSQRTRDGLNGLVEKLKLYNECYSITIVIDTGKVDLYKLKVYL